jgi:hypothetical protein
VRRHDVVAALLYLQRPEEPQYHKGSPVDIFNLVSWEIEGSGTDWSTIITCWRSFWQVVPVDHSSLTFTIFLWCPTHHGDLSDGPKQIPLISNKECLVRGQHLRRSRTLPIFTLVRRLQFDLKSRRSWLSRSFRSRSHVMQLCISKPEVAEVVCTVTMTTRTCLQHFYSAALD